MASNQPTIEQVGVALRAARDKAGKSQEDAASALGVSRVAISNYERGMLPLDFMAEKLPKLAALYGVDPASVVNLAIRRGAETGIASWRIPDDEPIANHLAKFPVPVQVWFHGFLSELLKLGLRDDIKAGAVERARTQITFGELDLWAGGDLVAPDVSRVLPALQWCAEAAWRNVTEPGWLRRPQDEWRELPDIFDVAGGDSEEPIGRRRRTGVRKQAAG